MSTRANFLIITPDSKVQQYYNHCDGYPCGLGNKLRKAIVLAIGMKSISDNENAKLYDLFMEEIKWNTRPEGEYGCLFGDYEKEELMELDEENQLHGDIEFIYIIVFNKLNVELYCDGAWRMCERLNTNKEVIDEVCKPENLIPLNKMIVEKKDVDE